MTMDALPLDGLAMLAVCAWVVYGSLRWYERHNHRAGNEVQAQRATAPRHARARGHRSSRDDHPHDQLIGQRGSTTSRPRPVQGNLPDDFDVLLGLRGARREVALPPGVPSITERLDPWVLDQLSEDAER